MILLLWFIAYQVSGENSENNLTISASYIPSTKTPPVKRIFPILSYNPPSNSLFLYSGYSLEDYLADIWTFSLDTFTWTIQRSFSEPTPGKLYSDPRSGSGGFSSKFESKFFVFGGVASRGINNDFWVFDLSKQKWQRIQTKNTPSPRQQYAYCSFDDGVHEYFVLYGGKTSNGTSDELWVLNITNQQWTKQDGNGDSPGGLFGANIEVYENSVYLTGGIKNFREFPSSAFFKYDFQGNYWTNLTTESIYPIRIYSKTELIGSKLYLFYGMDLGNFNVMDDVYTVDLSSSNYSWQRVVEKSDFGIIRFGMASVNSSIFIFGGSKTAAQTFCNTLVKFDTETLTFEVVSKDYTSPAPRHFHSMMLISGHFFMFGGKDGDNYYNDLWKFNPINEIWTPIDALGSTPTGRFSFAFSSQGDAFAIWGGENQIGLSNELYQFNTLTSTWQKFSPSGTSVPNPAKGACMVLLIPNIYIYGGITNSGYSNELWVYNLWTNSFTKLSTDIIAAYSTCHIYNNEFYVVFGSVLNSSPQTLIRKFNFDTKEWSSTFNTTDTGFGSIQGIQLFHNGEILKLGGQRWDSVADTSIYAFNYNNVSVMHLKNIKDFSYRSAYVYFNYSIYVFGGGETFEQGLLLGYSKKDLWKISMKVISEGTEYDVLCSAGTTDNGQTCELCDSGSYSEGIGNQTCDKCPPGTYNTAPGATSNRQCYPCNEGTFNYLSGMDFCYDCPNGYSCPAGSTDPVDVIQVNKFSSIQPKIYSEKNVSDQIFNWKLSIALTCSLVILIILMFEKTRNYLAKFDLYVLLHNHTK